MDSLLQSLSLGILLRCLSSGILGMISYRVARHGLGDLVAITSFEPREIGVALLSGATIYGIYRSLLYPVIECVLDSKRALGVRKFLPLISAQSCAALKLRWERAGNPSDKDAGIVKHTNSWADWAHMQYSSALCVGLGIVFGFVASDFATPCPLLILQGIVVAIFLTSALVSDWRLHAVEDHLSGR